MATFVLLSTLAGSNPTASPGVDTPCPVGFAVSGAAATGRRGAVLSTLPPTDNSTNMTGPCMCELFTNESTPYTDVSDTYCGNIPQEWYGAYHLTCPHCMEQGTTLNITCPNNWEACDIIINLYVCPGCSSTGGLAYHGLWPSSLATDGWTAAGRCVPSFCSSEGQHKFVGFHKQINGGDTENLPELATDPTMYFSVIVKEASVCETLTNANECQEALSCEWGNQPAPAARRGEQQSGIPCWQNWCPATAPVGPDGGCGNCPPGLPNGQCRNSAAPSASVAPSVAPVTGLFSTGVDGDRNALTLGTEDTHWQVKLNDGAWVQALYGMTNLWGSAPGGPRPIDHPYIHSGTPPGLPASKPIAHPDHWFEPTTSKDGHIPGAVFYWRQFFNVPAGEEGTFVANYRVGFDDTSLGTSGALLPPSCQHTVRKNDGIPQLQAAIRSPTTGIPTPSQYSTSCLGTITGPWQVGENKIEFAIKNVNTYYGFRFVALPPQSPPP